MNLAREKTRQNSELLLQHPGMDCMLLDALSSEADGSPFGKFGDWSLQGKTTEMECHANTK